MTKDLGLLESGIALRSSHCQSKFGNAVPRQAFPLKTTPNRSAIIHVPSNA